MKIAALRFLQQLTLVSDKITTTIAEYFSSLVYIFNRECLARSLDASHSTKGTFTPVAVPDAVSRKMGLTMNRVMKSKPTPRVDTSTGLNELSELPIRFIHRKPLLPQLRSSNSFAFY